MHHHPHNQERALNLSILNVSGKIYHLKGPRALSPRRCRFSGTVSRGISTNQSQEATLPAHRLVRVATARRLATGLALLATKPEARSLYQLMSQSWNPTNSSPSPEVTELTW